MLKYKAETEKMAKHLETLEIENEHRNHSIIGTKARSMRNNLIFYNIKETAKENTMEIIRDIFEEKFHVENALTTVKID